MKPDILLVEPLMQFIEDQLDAIYTVHRLYDPAQKDTLEAALPNIRAVATGGGTGLSNEWIEKLPSLGVIAINGVGTDKVDLKFTRGRNIDVTTTPGVLTDDVADMGIALMLGVLRHIAKGDAFVRAGKWGNQGFPLGNSPKGKRVGILGLGQIGKAFGRRAEAFGMDVRFWNRSPVKDTTWKSCASPVALAEDSDVLCVIVAANAATQNIVNAEVLKALGPKGILINIARGSVVDENALLAALNDGTIGAAGLDVYLDEPRIREDFFATPNTVLMPHQGSATVETRIAMGELVLANIAAHLAGEKPPTTVN
ncbi:2-hydroxyacid dehydrogenase [Neorhizobium galegae]|uniref:2-hydroxyacid dehydrogenase n=1 Tax=Neorhizobium galegae TaxID=399 RepID=UPI000620EBF9|nr:2-hydroxyacid dehydrogenase [Neorhizobium galegae]CDZ56945.1 Hydroxyphenylpyruvate reductase [Neorhizobium galegae bv. orientalis]KAB1122994.1 2-hydroxyacid dehydrogenase [Neorhizobium galegae]MCQ1570009.1 2-hydroxyacid dehydrogenase [Neorhizobium galegae]MCQ1807547.1 2-hydroxyacid dehydrogenase [Neorhizobium galegae]CDZ62299.1 Hydroxyphenylpyruvate reductase [Neorhizobium galegae bv. orientalis]